MLSSFIVPAQTCTLLQKQKCMQRAEAEKCLVAARGFYAFLERTNKASSSCDGRQRKGAKRKYFTEPEKNFSAFVIKFMHDGGGTSRRGGKICKRHCFEALNESHATERRRNP